MDQKTMDSIHAIQIGMMKELIALCKANGLSYTVLSGSLLGAVRHQGFIPWDDDMDIGLVREDYDKLMDILHRQPIEGCFLQDFTTDPHCFQPYAKLLRDHTVFIERFRRNSPARSGVFIDIFPLDHIEKPGQFSVRIRRLCSRFITFSIWEKENCHMQRLGGKKLINLAARVFRLLPKKMLISMQRALVIRNHPEWKYVASMFSCNYESDRFFFELSDFDHLVELPFETLTVSAPANWDEHLTRLFKNYMQYPPENKRNSGHDVYSIKV